MKKFAILLAGLSVAAAAVPASAFAAPAPAPRYGYDQGWTNINARQDRLEMRINQGVRSGALSRREAASLRGQFNSLVRLEAQYRRSGHGLSMAERADLDRRFDALSAKVRFEKHDRNDYHGRRY